MPVVGVMVDRHQLDRRDAKRRQVADGRLGRQTEVRAAQRFRHVRVQLGDSRARAARRSASRATACAAADRPPHVNAVSITAASGAYGALSRSSNVVSSSPDRYPNSASSHRTARPITLAYGSITSLCGVEAVALVRIVRSVNTVAIQLTRTDVRQVAMPDHVGVLGQGDRDRFDFRSTESNRQSSTRVACSEKMREIHTDAVPGRTERVRGAGPDAHVCSRHRRV